MVMDLLHEDLVSLVQRFHWWLLGGWRCLCTLGGWVGAPVNSSA